MTTKSEQLYRVEFPFEVPLGKNLRRTEAADLAIRNLRGYKHPLVVRQFDNQVFYAKGNGRLEHGGLSFNEETVSCAPKTDTLG